MKDIKFNPKALQSSTGKFLHNLRRNSSVLVFLLFTAVYGFMIIKINTYSNPVIDESAVLEEVKALPVPKLDEEAAQKLQSLNDNSVNVQSLFDQGRTNPFSE